MAEQLTDQTQRLPFAKMIIVYIFLALGLLLSFLDINLTSTLLPTVGVALNATSTITWAGTSYLIAQTALQVLYGRLSDIVGRKYVLLTSISLLAFGDLLSGFAQNGPWLYSARAVSGIGGGGISSVTQMIVSDLVSLKERGKYQGILGAAIGVGASSGPFIAAGLLQTGPIGWRWAFWIPPMIAACCAVPLWFLVPLKPVTGSWKEKVKRIDWLGCFTSVVGVLFILIPVNSGGTTWAWDSAIVIAMFVIGGIFAVAFVIIEWKFAKLPMLPGRLYGSRSLCTILVQNMLFGFVWQSELYFLPIYWQSIRQWSPIRSAILMLPYLACQAVAAIAGGFIMSKTCRYAPTLIAGFALWTLGSGLKILFDRSTGIAVIEIALFIEGVGVGFVFQPCK